MQSRRLLSFILILCMMAGMLPTFSVEAYADNHNGAAEVLIQGLHIGNIGYDPDNLFLAFQSNSVPGFRYEKSSDRVSIEFDQEYTDKNKNKQSGGYVSSNADNVKATFTITTADNPILAELIKSDTAEYRVYVYEIWGDRSYHTRKAHYTYCKMKLKVSQDGNLLISGESLNQKHDREVGPFDTGWKSLKGVKKIQIECKTERNHGNCCHTDKPANAKGICIYIRDNTCPEISYTYKYSDAVKTVDGNKKIFKLGTTVTAAATESGNPDKRYLAPACQNSTQEYVDLKFSFTKGVQPTNTYNVNFTRSSALKNLETDMNNKLTAVSTNSEKIYTVGNEILKLEERRLEIQTLATEILEKTQMVADIADAYISEGGIEAISEGGIGVLTDIQKSAIPEETFNIISAGGIEALSEAGIKYPFTGGINFLADQYMKEWETTYSALQTELETITSNEATDTDLDITSSLTAVQQADIRNIVATNAGVYKGDAKAGLLALVDYLADYSNAEGGKINSTEYGYFSSANAKEEDADTREYLDNLVKVFSDSAIKAIDDALTEKNKEKTDCENNAEPLYKAYEDAKEKYDAQYLQEENNATNIGASAPESLQNLLSHTLFTNTLGTGYAGMGENRGLELMYGETNSAKKLVLNKYSYARSGSTVMSALSFFNSKNYITKLDYRYSAQRGDYNGYNTIENGGWIENNATNHTSLLQKIYNAGFHDAAGNPLKVNGKIFNSSTWSGTGKNPFDAGDGGYNVCVDAEPPTYTKVGNGITPDILTGLVVNNNDTIEFIVSFSEEVKMISGMDISKTYLLLNNGGRAYYTKTSADRMSWIFKYELGTDGARNGVDTSLLKAIALTNESLDEYQITGPGIKGNATQLTGAYNDALVSFNVDGRIITDLAGNILYERANESANTNEQQIESSIDWARLSVDNVAPEISFTYNPYNAYLTVPKEDASVDGKAGAWGQAGKIYVSADDPAIATPEYDPDQTYEARPSKGVFRPDSATAAGEEGSSNGGGLIFYVWSQDPIAPSTGENFEVVKRFSLAGWDAAANEQMKDPSSPYSSWAALYAAGQKLTLANNYSEIVPPEKALLSENSGEWYLHVWTADMSWDSARQLMQYDKMYGYMYNINPETGKTYTNQEAILTKSALTTAKYKAMNQSSSSTYSYDDAWNDVKADYYTNIYAADFNSWLEEESDKYSDDALVKARNKAMKLVGNYADTAVWSLDLFRNDDSNWTLETASIRLDNTVPYAEFVQNSVEGNNTSKAREKFTVYDAHSGVDADEIYYQWVLKPSDAGSSRPEETKALNEIDWIKAPEEAVSMSNDGLSALITADTYGNVAGSGDYYLSVKFSDKAGNKVVTHSEIVVSVNVDVNIECIISQVQAEAEYYSIITPAITVSGLSIGKFEYAYSTTPGKPATGFTQADSFLATDTDTQKYYQLPALDSSKSDGTWYVHVLVYEKSLTNTEPYYFFSSYSLDHTAPQIYLNPQGGAVEKSSYTVNFSAVDYFSGINEESLMYQWTTGSDASSCSSKGWRKISAGESITKEITKPSENGSYYLHIRVKDNAGNDKQIASEAFRLKVDQEIKTDPIAVTGDMLAVYSKSGSIYGVVELSFDTDNKAGCYFSTSSNGGKNWSSWEPYANMIELPLPVDSESQLTSIAEGTLQVRYKDAYGDISPAVSIKAGKHADNPVWATAELESLRAKKEGKALYILMNVCEGATAELNTEKTVSETTAAVVKDAEGDFAVYGNGLYYFTIEKGSATASFCISVDVYDTSVPEGYIVYSEIAPTTENVYATLETSEDVTIKEIKVYDTHGILKGTKPGRNKYVFTENGRAEFVFYDAAGNENTAVATVNNIDRATPDVKIITLYNNGKGKEYTAFTGAGGKTMSSGLFLSVIKDPSGNGKDFTVVSGDKSNIIEVTKNGTYSFTVMDGMGNIKQVSAVVDSISEIDADPVISYSFASATNAGLIPGEAYRNDSVKAKIEITAPSDGRKIYLGQSSNTNASPLTLEGGKYVYTQVYSSNGSKNIYFNDGMGGFIKAEVTIEGIDKTAPVITLNSPSAILKLKNNSEILSGAALIEALGGYTVSDRETTAGITVQIGNIDASRSAITLGKNDGGVYTVRYWVKDAAGNESYADQQVLAYSEDDIFITASEVPLLNSGNNTAIIDDNHVSFKIDQLQMQRMFYRGSAAYNRKMTYDIYYTTGLYREGQMKYIAEKITEQELLSRSFEVTFEKSGWYTIIIRNQERNRIFSTFFISSVSQ